jgi:penicillin-binding protein 2
VGIEIKKLTISERYRYAIVVTSIVVLACFAGLVKLQIIQFEQMKEMSETNRLRVVPILPKRGHIVDREGRVIVDNRPSYTVSVIPVEEIPYRTLPQLSTLIGFDTTYIRKRLNTNMVSLYQPTPVRRDVPFETIAVLEEQYERFPGVSYQMERVRQYVPNIGGQAFTGYVGEISESELKSTEFEYARPGSVVGKKGLERQYDKLLRGQEGTAYIEVSSSGQIIGEYEGKPPVKAVPGADLTLAIDLDLQQVIVSAMDTFCCGGIIAMDPRNGEVLAMVSFPPYDANIFSSVIPDSLWNRISNDSTHPLLNRPLKGLYPPGSTVKLLTLGAGMEEGLTSATKTFKPCIGGYQFGNRFFRCWKHDGHGFTTAVSSIEKSCDVYYYQLGLELGVDKISRYFELSGFGRKSGIDLPNEDGGLIPNSAYYNRRYGEKRWTKGLVLNISIGQGEVLVNIFQLAQFFCGLVNYGIVYKPHLVRMIHHPDQPSEMITPEVAFKLPFSNTTLKTLNEGLRQVVEGKDGTARGLKNKFYSIGGKTGTAENPHGENHSWFVGVAPLEAPEIVVAAIIENAGDGSKVAAPLVGEIIKAYMLKKEGMKEIMLAEEEAKKKAVEEKEEGLADAVEIP